MEVHEAVTSHYTRSERLEAVRAGIRAAGGDPDHPTLADLAPHDELHVGGLEATRMLIARLAGVARPGARVLDVGCGLGGPARVLAAETGCDVVGVDLTPEFVRAGTALTAAVGLADRVRLLEGSATGLPLDDGSVDAAWQLHVGMNIPDKAAVAREVHRVLRPGGVFVVYDIMGDGNEALRFPVPWATDPSFSAVEPPAAYRAHLEAAGFQVTDERAHGELARRALAARRAAGFRDAGSSGAPFANLEEAVAAGRVAPVEIVAVRPG